MSCILSRMSSPSSDILRVGENEGGRRQHVLDAALLIFARYGYRKASMEDVARAADISRPGLYLYFPSKQDLFRAAVTYALDGDVAAAARTLIDTARPLRDRLIDAFDQWTGRYVGPLTKDVALLIENNPDLLGPLVTDYPQRFATLVTDAIAADMSVERARLARDVAQTLLSTAYGIKHETSTREDFRARMTIGIDLLLLALQRSRGSG
jgi:AcrR family transcriptional regulator